MKEDIYIRFLRQYYEDHGTINDIPNNLVVEFEGQTLRIYRFLANMRFRHKQYLKGSKESKLFLERCKALEEMEIKWSNPRLKSDFVSEEIEIRYLKEHYKQHGTINNIRHDEIVEFEGQKIRVGAYLTRLRTDHNAYITDKRLDIVASSTFLMRYQILDELGIEWNLRDKKSRDILENDICLRYLKWHFNKFGTINDIKSNTVVEFENQTLKIGKFIKEVRRMHKKYLKGHKDNGCRSEVSLQRYQALDEMNFTWEIQKEPISSKKGYDPYIEYLKEHYKKHGTINDITVKTIVEFNGLTLKIGDFLSKTRSDYKLYISGDRTIRSSSELKLSRYASLTEMNFIWEQPQTVSLTQIAKENNFCVSTFCRLVKRFNGDIDKAIKVSQVSRKNSEQKNSDKKSEYSLTNILKEFDIDLDKLLNCLNASRLRTTEYQERIMYDENITLRDFCITNGYNYSVISYAIKLRMKGLCEESLESLINRSIIEYNIKGQGAPSTWIYSKYSNELLVKHLLLSMGVDSKNILNDMSRNAISLDEALANESFKKNTKSGYGYLEGIYQEFVSYYEEVDCSSEYTAEHASEALLSYAKGLITAYHLTQEEFEIITNSFKQYTNSLYQYRLFDVAFEKDETKRVEKIRKYKLDEDDIEEAFFLPLKFDQKVLLGRNSELYKRRHLLKNLTVSWNSLTEEERTSKITNYNLTAMEQQYITETRQKIDDTKAKVFQKK